MADHFVDGVNGNDANSGHTMDLAWKTVAYAEASGGLANGDIVWIRRNVAETPVADVTAGADGTITAPVYRIGCPRTTVAITSSDWTNGSTAVTIDDGGMAQDAHAARMITAPDGNDYFITRVQSSTGITLSREYAGTTVTNQAATIKADEDYTLFNAIDDSAWTIKKANWNADAHTLPTIDFNDGAYQYNISDSRHAVFKNMKFMDSADTNGIVYITTNRAGTTFKNCIIKQTASNTRLFMQATGGFIYCNQVIISGSGSGAAQDGLRNSTHNLYFKDVAIYGCGNFGVYNSGAALFENVNIGVEVANGASDLSFESSTNLTARNLRLGGTNGYVASNGLAHENCTIKIENYQTLGEHRTYWNGGYFMKQAMPDSTIAAKKVSDYAMKILPNVTGYTTLASMTEWHTKIFEAVITASAAAHTYRVWIFNNAMGTLNDTTAYDNIWMRVEYVKSYDDTSEYVIGYTDSAQIDIANAASSSDWDYLEASVTPAVADKVRISIYLNAYHATGTIYLDPAVVIS